MARLAMQTYTGYARWLVEISWARFVTVALALLLLVGGVQGLAALVGSTPPAGVERGASSVKVNSASQVGVSPAGAGVGGGLLELATLFAIASMALKYPAGRERVANQAAHVATEIAAEELAKRNWATARAAVLEKSLDPDLLFNTLASVDYLIDRDPVAAQQTQRQLIRLMRATLMQAKRGCSASGPVWTIGSEMDGVTAYLDVLSLRMEERLRSEVFVGEGVESAELPAMLLQQLVASSIRHGLEPKPDGGLIRIEARADAERLVVVLADSGCAWCDGSNAECASELVNVRERLRSMYGDKASLSAQVREPWGNMVEVTIPYSVGRQPGCR